MVSKLWLNILLWGLGDRLEKKNDYKTDILLVLDIMIWYSLFFFATLNHGLIYWLVGIVELPEAWIGTQLGVGYIMVKKAERPKEGRNEETAYRTKKNDKEAMSAGSKASTSESEEP